MPPWLTTFLPLLRCPTTQQPLRPASQAELERVGLPRDHAALANASGTQVYPIIDNMPHLLPTSAMECRPEL